MSRTLARVTDVSFGSPLTLTLLMSATADAAGLSFIATLPLEGLPADNRPDQLFFVWQILSAEFRGDARCRVSLLANDAGAAPGPTDDPRGLVRTTANLRLEFDADCPAITNAPLLLLGTPVCSDGPLDSDAVTWSTVTPTESPLSFTTAGGSPVAVGAAVLEIETGGLTTEQVQDAVADMLVAGDGVALDYDDEAGTLEISATGGSGGSGATLKIPVTQAGHGFSDYQAVYPTPDGYGLALALQADADDRRADAAGVIIVTSDDTFDLYRAGKIEGGPFTGAGETWFLSDTAPGLIALDAPTAEGSVWKPLVQVQPDGTALVSIEAGHIISTAEYALDGEVLHATGDETKSSGTLTFTVSPLVPTTAPGTSSLVAASTAFVTGALATGLATKADLVGGQVPSAQLPGYVDDVIEAVNFAALPGTGEAGKIYVTLDNSLIYRWSGSAYVEISASLTLGETSATAYRGDRGKTAYDHSQITSSNPHGTTYTDVGAASDGDLTDHIEDFNAHTGNTTTAHGAVSTATASKHVVRDGSARAKFAAGATTDDALVWGQTIGGTTTWQGTAVADSYIASAATWNAKLTSPMITLGDVIYGGASGAATRLGGNTATVKQYLSQTGNGTISAAPAWAALDTGDIGSGTLAAARGGTGVSNGASCTLTMPNAAVTVPGSVAATVALATGLAGGQTITGGTASGENLTLASTSHATKGKIFFGAGATSAYDGVNDRIGIGTASPSVTLELSGTGSPFQATRIAASGSACAFTARKATTGTTAVASGDQIGSFNFSGHDGTGYILTAAIRTLCDGAVSTGVVPQAIVFYSGSSASLTERARFNSSGSLTFAEGVNIVLGTTTGTKIGTATTQKLGFWNATPVVRAAAYTPTNVTTDRAFDANATTLDELSDVVGTLIADLQSYGLLG